MVIKTETFKEPFLEAVESTVEKAYSICWEGCHKIYICLNKEAHEDQISYGYDMVMVEDKEEAVQTLYQWFDNSCGLRFINAIDGTKNGNDAFSGVIEQFEYDRSEEDD